MQRELPCFDGRKIINVSDATEQHQDGYFIIANKLHSQELKFQIEGLGISEERIYICDRISSGVGILSDFNKYCANMK